MISLTIKHWNHSMQDFALKKMSSIISTTYIWMFQQIVEQKQGKIDRLMFSQHQSSVSEQIFDGLKSLIRNWNYWLKGHKI